MISYSAEFIKRIKKSYGEYSKAHHLSLSGDENLGIWLKNNIDEGISYSQIFSAKSLKYLQDLASTNLNMYELWYDEMLAAYGNDKNALDRYLHANSMYVDIEWLEAGRNGLKS